MRIYNKLVRNKIPEIIRVNGGEPSTHEIPRHDVMDWLKRKLYEEVEEYLTDSNIEELADIFEVILEILDVSGLSFDSLDTIRKKKAREKGTFSKHILLEYVQDRNSW